MTKDQDLTIRTARLNPGDDRWCKLGLPPGRSYLVASWDGDRVAVHFICRRQGYEREQVLIVLLSPGSPVQGHWRFIGPVAVPGQGSVFVFEVPLPEQADGGQESDDGYPGDGWDEGQDERDRLFEDGVD